MKCKLVIFSSCVFLTLTIADSQTFSSLKGTVTNVSERNSYTVSVNTSGTTIISPIQNGTEGATAMEFIVSASPGTNLFVSFVLPNVFYNGSSTIHAGFFNNNTLFLKESNQYMSPYGIDSFTVGSSGVATFYLGLIISLPPLAPPGGYYGTVIAHLTTEKKSIASISESYSVDVIDIATGVENDKRSGPVQFSLGQSFPNPFNPTARITYTLPERSAVSLKIYNLLGLEIATLVDEVQDPGENVVYWNPIEAPSGVYLYRLTAGNHSAVKRMIFMK